LADIQSAEYSSQIELPAITEKEVRDAIRAASPFKAPGPDGIVNRALQTGARLVATHLTSMFNRSLRLGYCPSHFRESTTAVLRKPGKDNYTVPKAYRPIALLNTVGKVMDAVIARRLNYLVETHHVLPETHIGGRKMRSTEHALSCRHKQDIQGMEQRRRTGGQSLVAGRLGRLRQCLSHTTAT
jgi:hypothetical protein